MFSWITKQVINILTWYDYKRVTTLPNSNVTVQDFVEG